MNKKELIGKIKSAETLYLPSGPFIGKKLILGLVKQLNEPKERVTLPRPVANWISCVRGQNKTLHFALENAPEEVNLWFCEDEKNRQNVFADAWVNGYHIEKEKQYIVAVKNIDKNCKYLKWNVLQKYWYIGNDNNTLDLRSHHTMEKLQKGGFGDVFTNPLFEVEEVD